MWIGAMAVAAANPSVLVMDTQLRTLIPADHAGLADGALVRVVVAAGALATAPLDVPAAAGTRHDVMCFRSSFSHSLALS
jgi:hypothetical protein